MAAARAVRFGAVRGEAGVAGAGRGRDRGFDEEEGFEACGVEASRSRGDGTGEVPVPPWPGVRSLASLGSLRWAARRTVEAALRQDSTMRAWESGLKAWAVRNSIWMQNWSR